MDAAKPGMWSYHSSMITDQHPWEIARLCVWEKLLDHLPHEVPYEIKVVSLIRMKEMRCTAAIAF